MTSSCKLSLLFAVGEDLEELVETPHDLPTSTATITNPEQLLCTRINSAAFPAQSLGALHENA